MFISDISVRKDFLDNPKDVFPFKLGNIANLVSKSLVFHKPIVFFVGENGSGKTTLLEGVASCLGVSKFGGSKNFLRKEGDVPILDKFLIIGKKGVAEDVFFFRAENFFNIQENLDSYGPDLTKQFTGSNKSFRELSHGQGFKALFENRVRENSVYFFDEPESALSVASQIEFLFLLKEFVALGNQLVIATHSPILLAFPQAQIVSFDNDVLTEVAFEDTDMFISTKGFLDNYQRYQKELLDE